MPKAFKHLFGRSLSGFINSDTQRQNEYVNGVVQGGLKNKKQNIASTAMFCFLEITDLTLSTISLIKK